MVSHEGPKRVSDGVVPPSQDRWPRNSWSRHREQVRASNRARTVAVRLLIAEFPDDWDRVYAEQCALEDPPVVPRPRKAEDPAWLAGEIARLKQLVEDVECDGE